MSDRQSMFFGQKRFIASFLLGISLSIFASPVFAADPFRSENPRNIDAKTEAAFEAIFREGNYPEAKNYLIQAETTNKNEPLVYAIRAALAYTEKDWETLKTYAQKTLETAENLNNDPLRSNLYLAIGNFLDGAYTFEKDGPLGAVTKLQKVFEYIDKAEAVDANDPELNLIKGYMDLILAVNLPFSSPDQAIERLENNAAPKYLVDRGIAVAYRDLKQLENALEFADKAIDQAPNNPELIYLKGQILRKQARSSVCDQGFNDDNQSLLNQALQYFDQALQKSAQLPKLTLKPLQRERDKTAKLLEQKTCDL
jgi:tetratricopeptide (TPR) repeat protein